MVVEWWGSLSYWGERRCYKIWHKTKTASDHPAAGTSCSVPVADYCTSLFSIGLLQQRLVRTSHQPHPASSVGPERCCTAQSISLPCSSAFTGCVSQNTSVTFNMTGIPSCSLAGFPIILFLIGRWGCPRGTTGCTPPIFVVIHVE